MTDHDLLTIYARDASEEAFTEIVRRHGDLVYSVSKRVLRDDHLAEDVSQATFMVLAQKAKALPRGTLLSGWLYTTACNMALNHQRSVQRRSRGEAAAANVREPASDNATDQIAWAEVREHVDAALQELSAPQREAIVLRCLKQMSPAEAAVEMGVSEKAVSMRLSRGLDELKEKLKQRGVATTSALLLGLITMNSAEAAPAAATATVAVAVGKAPASNAAMTLAKGVLKLMFWTKVKTAAVASVALLLIAGGTAVGVSTLARAGDETSKGAKAAPTPEAPAPAPFVAKDTPKPAAPAPLTAEQAVALVKKDISGIIGEEGKVWAKAEPFDKRIPEPLRPWAFIGTPGRNPQPVRESNGRFRIAMVSVELKQPKDSIWWEYDVAANGSLKKQIQKRLDAFPPVADDEKPLEKKLDSAGALTIVKAVLNDLLGPEGKDWALAGTYDDRLPLRFRGNAYMGAPGKLPVVLPKDDGSFWITTIAVDLKDAENSTYWEYHVLADGTPVQRIKSRLGDMRPLAMPARNEAIPPAEITAEIAALTKDIADLEKKLPPQGAQPDAERKALTILQRELEAKDLNIEQLKRDIEAFRRMLNHKLQSDAKQPVATPPAGGDF